MLDQVFRSWRAVLTQPSVATFDRERPNAAIDRVLAGVLLAGVIAGIGTAIGRIVLSSTMSFLPMMAGQTDTPFSGGSLGVEIASMLGALILTPLATLFGFFVWAGILFLVAKALGGPGDFVAHTYLLSLGAAPLTALGGVFGIIPCLAILAGIPLFIYQLVLSTLALQSAHSFSVGRAVAVWLIPALVFIFLAMCLAFAVAAAVMAFMVRNR